ncbi:MAG: DnaJ domain-containing protein [Myxococcaceae bacterium]|jgi:curved DNA-binding protein CbpA|nr:DnaJ domain-containing protein [Myxococcaceae bacterium]MCA3011533.1 DnaJ domain-containing protein [Myxococcaceae bacterium]
MAEGETVDIPQERQAEILALEAKLKATHFEVLGLAPGATSEEVRSAFHALSRKFHPDRFHGRQLGSFKGKIDAVFKRLIEANNVLTDAEKRQKYLDENPGLRGSAGGAGAPSAAPAVKTADEEARDAERRARFARHPYLARASRTQEHITKAKAHIAKHEYSHAFSLLNIAAQMDPQNAEVKALLNDVRKKNDSQRSETDLKRAEELVSQGNDDLALQALRAAVNANASNHEAAYKAALILERKGADVREITGYAQKAVDAAPGRVEYRVLLGRLLDAAGMKALAKKHFEEALRLGPDHPDVKKHVKKRWPF